MATGTSCLSKNWALKIVHVPFIFLHRVLAIEPDSLLTIDNDPQRNNKYALFRIKNVKYIRILGGFEHFEAYLTVPRA